MSETTREGEMMMTATTAATVVRTGRLMIEQQPGEWRSVLMRQWTDGEIDLYLTTCGDDYRWVAYTGDRADQIAWDETLADTAATDLDTPPFA